MQADQQQHICCRYISPLSLCDRVACDAQLPAIQCSCPWSDQGRHRLFGSLNAVASSESRGPHPLASLGPQQSEATLTRASSGCSLPCQQPVMGGCGVKQVHPIPQHHTGACPRLHSGWPLPGGKLLPLLCKWVLARCLWLLHLLGSDRSISWPLPEAAFATIWPLPKPVALWQHLAGREMPLN